MLRKEHVALQKKLTWKNNSLDEKTNEISRARERSAAREEAFKKDLSKLESELASTNLKLEVARKEPEKVKEIWNSKVQKLHGKVASREAELKSQREAYKILDLDNAATLDDLRTSQTLASSLQKQVDSQKAELGNVSNLRKERDGLKMSLLSARTNQKIENDKITKAVREAQAVWEAQKNILEEDNRKLKQERDADVQNICELSRMKNTYAQREARKDAEIDKLKSDLEEKRLRQQQLQDTSGRERLAALEEERVKVKYLAEALRIICSASANALAK